MNSQRVNTMNVVHRQSTHTRDIQRWSLLVCTFTAFAIRLHNEIGWICVRRYIEC
jgi:hypothetical protein